MKTLSYLTTVNKDGSIDLKCDTEQAVLQLASYESAEKLGYLQRLSCRIGDRVRDVNADYVFTVQKIEIIELDGEKTVLYRCGNPGTEDYMAFFEKELGKTVTIVKDEDK